MPGDPDLEQRGVVGDRRHRVLAGLGPAGADLHCRQRTLGHAESSVVRVTLSRLGHHP